MLDYKETLKELQEGVQKQGEENQELVQSFFGFVGTVEKDGVLSAKTKELIAIALSIKSQCEPCIAYHVHGALSKGATKEEVMEASWVAVLMGGGPSLMYLLKVRKAIEDFSQ